MKKNPKEPHKEPAAGRNVAARPALYRDRAGIHRADTCDLVTSAVRRGELHLAALVRGTYPGRPLPVGILPHVKTVGLRAMTRRGDCRNTGTKESN